MESHKGGPIIIKEYIKLTKEYIQDKIESKNDANKNMPNLCDDKYIKLSTNKLYAYIYLENANQSKCNSVLKNLN